MFLTRSERSLRRLCAFVLVALGLAGRSLSATEVPTDAADDDLMGDMTLLPAFNVTADRIEDFGFRVSAAIEPGRSSFFRRVYTPIVDVVLPNTAASKVGLRPGDRIVSSDGQPTASGTFSIKKWRRIQETKWAAVAAGRKDVTWALVVESEGTGELRTLSLRIPTPPPCWGAAVWRTPEDRSPAVVPEPGPLAERAREVLDHGIWVLLRGSYVRGLDLHVEAGKTFLLCYQWTLWSGSAGHRIYVSQQHGRTDIILEAIFSETRAALSATAPTAAPVPTLASVTTVFARDSRAYLTSPSGSLEKAWLLPRIGGQREIPIEDAQAEFQREVDFWLNRVGKVSPRWPLAVIATNDSPVAHAGSAPDSAESAPPSPPLAGRRAADFLKLPLASAGERALLDEAFEKLGADEDRWAYTETTRTTSDGQGVTVVRVDPSRPEPERCTLLEIGGKTPTAQDVRRWREEGRDSSDPLGELGGIRDMVDRADARVFAREAAAIVFELPLAGGVGSLAADQLQSLFRVNPVTRAFEEIVVQARESIRLAGGATLAEAGSAVRFRTIDPAYPPQPVWLRDGGAVRVLLVKFARDTEITRADFTRVPPGADQP